MSDDRSSAPLASFEAKWSEAYPEFGLALRFVRGADRDERSAFACLVFEIEHAAFAIREAQPAAIKLQWWAEELARANRGEARHPLTQAVSSRLRAAAIPISLWQQVIIGAAGQRDPEPAADSAALFDAYARFYVPLANIEAAMFGAPTAETADTLTRVRALRETAALPDALRDGKLPLPLDVLARHRLARGDLAEATAARRDALREWLQSLADEFTASRLEEAGQPLGALRSVIAAVNSARAQRAARAADPLTAIRAALARLAIGDVWAAWRAARRSRR